jgi:hypothetical protein
MSFFCSSRFLIEDSLFSPINLKESATDIVYTRDELQIRFSVAQDCRVVARIEAVVVDSHSPTRPQKLSFVSP